MKIKTEEIFYGWNLFSVKCEQDRSSMEHAITMRWLATTISAVITEKTQNGNACKWSTGRKEENEQMPCTWEFSRRRHQNPTISLANIVQEEKYSEDIIGYFEVNKCSGALIIYCILSKFFVWIDKKMILFQKTENNKGNEVPKSRVCDALCFAQASASSEVEPSFRMRNYVPLCLFSVCSTFLVPKICPFQTYIMSNIQSFTMSVINRFIYLVLWHDLNPQPQGCNSEHLLLFQGLYSSWFILYKDYIEHFLTFGLSILSE